MVRGTCVVSWYTCTIMVPWYHGTMVLEYVWPYTCTYSSTGTQNKSARIVVEIRAADIAVELEPQLYQVVYRDVFYADNAHYHMVVFPLHLSASISSRF